MLPQGTRVRCAMTRARLDSFQDGWTWVGNHVQIVQIALRPNRELNPRDHAIRVSRIPSAFAKAYPDTVDEKFAGHWDTWFTQSHVNQFVELGINTVRVPVCMHANILCYSILTRRVDCSARLLDC